MPTSKGKPKAKSKPRQSKSQPQPQRKTRSQAAQGRSAYDTTKSNGIQAGQNMLSALGGRESVIAILEDSAHPKARLLIDRLQSTSHIGENFATSYTAVGLKSIDVLEIFGDVTQARVFINALQEGDEVVRSLIRAAKDQITPHEKCNATGRKIDPKTGKETGEDCKQCHGSGYTLQAGSLESQKVYLELIQWRKSGGLVQIDARKQQANVQVFGTGQFLPGSAPDPLAIIKKADQVLLPPASSGSVPLESNDSERMPEDVMEAETI